MVIDLYPVQKLNDITAALIECGAANPSEIENMTLGERQDWAAKKTLQIAIGPTSMQPLYRAAFREVQQRRGTK